VHTQTKDSRSFSLTTVHMLLQHLCMVHVTGSSSVSVKLLVATWFFVTGIGHVWAEDMLRRFINLPRSYSNRPWWKMSPWAMACLKQLVSSLSPHTPRSASVPVHVGFQVWKDGTGTGFSSEYFGFTCPYHSTNVL
jgi:hypothetical protein